MIGYFLAHNEKRGKLTGRKKIEQMIYDRTYLFQILFIFMFACDTLILFHFLIVHSLPLVLPAYLHSLYECKHLTQLLLVKVHYSFLLNGRLNAGVDG